MATEFIRIVITDQGTRRVQGNMRNLGREATRTNAAVNLLRKALLLVGGVAVIRVLVNLADTFTNIQNRLRLVTDGVDELNAVTEELFQISRRTRSEFEATAQVYARTALATKNLGLTQRETLQFTEALNQAVILSGASAQEASAGLRQLSQGLASNRLSGDELRSVLEQLPLVADVISQSLGITRGELRKLGEQGLITADVVLQAFKEARVELAERFAETIPTVSQAFTVLRNNLLRGLGEFNMATGASRSLSNAILMLSENMNILAKSVFAVALFVGTLYARVAIPRAIAATRALGLAIATNPIGALAIVITGVIATLVAFRNDITLTSDSITTLNDVFRATGIVIGELLDDIQPAFQSIKSEIVLLSQTLLGFVPTFVDVFRFIALALDEGIRIFTRFRILGQTAFALLFAGIPELAQNGINFITSFVESGIDLFRAFTAGVLGGFRNLSRIIGLLFTNVGLAARAAIRGDFEQLAQLAANQARLFRNAGGIVADGFVNGFTDSFERLGKERLIPEVEFIAAGATKAVIESLLKELDAIPALKPFEDALKRILGLADGIAAARQAAFKAEEGDIFTLPIQEIKVAATFTETVFKGLRAGLAGVKLELEDIAAVASGLVTNAFQTAEDAFVEFTRTGKFNFTSLIDSIQRDLAKLVFREAIAGIAGGISGAFGGGGGGGAGGFLGKIFGGAANRATGGPVSAGQLVATGGRDPELFVPETDGFITPINADRGAAGAAPIVTKPTINLTLINVVDMAEAESAVASSRDEEVILNVITDNKSLIKQVIS